MTIRPSGTPADIHRLLDDPSSPVKELLTTPLIEPQLIIQAPPDFRLNLRRQVGLLGMSTLALVALVVVLAAGAPWPFIVACLFAIGTGLGLALRRAGHQTALHRRHVEVDNGTMARQLGTHLSELKAQSLLRQIVLELLEHGGSLTCCRRLLSYTDDGKPVLHTNAYNVTVPGAMKPAFDALAPLVEARLHLEELKGQITPLIADMQMWDNVLDQLRGQPVINLRELGEPLNRAIICRGKLTRALRSGGLRGAPVTEDELVMLGLPRDFVDRMIEDIAELEADRDRVRTQLEAAASGRGLRAVPPE